VQATEAVTSPHRIYIKVRGPWRYLYRAIERTIQSFEAMLWLRKGFGFAGAWTVREQNRLLALCFGLPEVNKV